MEILKHELHPVDALPGMIVAAVQFPVVRNDCADSNDAFQVHVCDSRSKENRRPSKLFR